MKGQVDLSCREICQEQIIIVISFDIRYYGDDAEV